ncbi:MAG: hypothetical protein NVSMB2_13120 [Chloroflexota bacterium]
MRLTELRGLPVIDPTAARKIGTVAEFQVDPTSGRLAAIDLSGSDARDPERILASRIRRVGRNAVILTARGGATPGTPPEINDRWLDSSTLVGLEVMGDDGNRVGHLVDATFNQDTFEIEAYLLRAGGLSRVMGKRARIVPDTVHSCSRDLMMVNSGRTRELAPATTPTASVDESPTIGLRIPLKPEDRLPAPSFDSVPESHPVPAPGS